MNIKKVCFIGILRDFIHNLRGEYLLSSEMLDYAKTQEVEGIVSYQTKDERLKSGLAQAFYYSRNRQVLIQLISDQLVDIKHFYVKGHILAKYYPVNELRTMGDIDIVVFDKGVHKAIQNLCDVGFVVVDDNGFETRMKKGIFDIEIHSSLLHPGIGYNNEKARTYFEHCWDYVEDNVLDKNYHFLFTLQHLKGHMVSEGVGFRQFMDVALFSRDPELDWCWIIEELPKIDLLDFARIVFAFNKRWFDVEPPIPVEDVDDEFYEQATEKIFAGGVFGHEDESNRDASIVKAAVNNGTDLKSEHGRYLMKQMFPNYETMCRLPYCSYVKKTKVLLPIAWIHRIIKRSLDKKHRDSFINRAVKADGSQERIELLQKWGL